MGVRTFQAPCSPHSRGIDSVRPATEQPNLTLSITGGNAGVNGTLHTPTHNLPHCPPPRTLPHFLHSAILSPLSVSMRGSLSATPLPLKKDPPAFRAFSSCTGEPPTEIPVATNFKFKPEVPYYPYNNALTKTCLQPVSSPLALAQQW